MKAVIIKGLELPDQDGFTDIRIYGDGTAVMPMCMGSCVNYDVEEIELPEEEKK